MRFFGAMVTAGVLTWVGVARADVPAASATGEGGTVGAELASAGIPSDGGKVGAELSAAGIPSDGGKVGVELPSKTVRSDGARVDDERVGELNPGVFRLRPGPVSFGGTEFDWAGVRGNVASVGLGPLAIQPRRGLWGSSGGGGAMKTVGVVLVALGGLTLFGAGVSAIVAGVEAADLNDECPNKVCVEGTRGGRSLERARGAALATDWLIGIGGPVAASGTVMLIYAAALNRIGKAPSTGPVVFAGPTGGSLRFQF